MRLISKPAVTLWLCLFILASVSGAKTAVFVAPDTPDGWQGIGGLAAHGVVDHPTGPDLKPSAPWFFDPNQNRYWSEENIDHAFWEAASQKVTLLVTINSAGNWTGPWPYKYSSFWLAESSDGMSFPAATWSEIFWTDPDVDDFRIHHANLLPGRGSQVYTMLFGITRRNGTRGTGRALIDAANQRFRIQTPLGMSAWRPWGEQLTELPAEAGAVSGTRATLVDGETQQWLGLFVGRSGDAPCDPNDPEYLLNTANHAGGRRLAYRTYQSRSTGSGPVIQAQPPLSDPNNLEDVWTDYGGSMTSPFNWGENLQSVTDPRMWDYGSRKILYYSSNDLRICEYNHDWNPWHGSTVKALRMARQPNGEYVLQSKRWLLNIRYPNWTCVAGVSPCYADDERDYAFIGAIPVRIPGTGEVHFYVPIWGGFAFE